MTDRISGGGQTETIRGGALDRAPSADKGKQAKAETLQQRRAQGEQGAQTRTHNRRHGAKTGDTITRTAARTATQATKREGGFFQRIFAKKPPLTQEQIRHNERLERRERLHKQGPQLEQHKRDYQEARTKETHDKEQRLVEERQQRSATTPRRLSTTGAEARLRTASMAAGSAKGETKRETVDVIAHQPAAHGMRDRFDALHQLAKHTAEGREVRFVNPKATLPERHVALHEGGRSFLSRAGTKFKDLMLKIFRPQKWEARQVALRAAQKAELSGLAENFSRVQAESVKRMKNIEAQEKVIEQRKTQLAERVAEKERNQALQQSPPKKDISASAIDKDPKLTKNPEFIREREKMSEGVDELRRAMEQQAVAATRTKLDEQSGVAEKRAEDVPPPKPSRTQAPQPAPPSRDPVSTEL